jgi:hypothetical protein
MSSALPDQLNALLGKLEDVQWDLLNEDWFDTENGIEDAIQTLKRIIDFVLPKMPA